MFEADVDDYDSDIDTPDPDILYRIMNAPIPQVPKLKLPKWFGIPDLNLQWRRLKHKRGLMGARAIAVGLFATFVGLLFYFYHLLQ